MIFKDATVKHDEIRDTRNKLQTALTHAND